MQALDVVIEDARWADLDLESLAQTAALATLSHLGIDAAGCEMTVLACDDARITVLNGDFRDKTKATNVLSWPAEERGATQPGGDPLPALPGPDGMIELGDIAISYDTCAAEAAAADKPVQAHVTHLIVHGVLHLLGFDHICDPDAALMEGLEVEILGKLGHDDPYRIIPAD
ncbi:rRNA maturation RNase YbeY [Sulfitobacter mediterraneus]|uniref:rRNA maturation RNase YbeY n=1 Tax=Sulfitobacter mediterraneus TaxID=83219 RepID=UPI001931CA2E|nr:rRNA maturation RNase YbeY [Sulfitobacter mediterraneus]MBM1310422.1 rRNA maturation RNase YbeY [Sulfitobacter mediterraneus]MBM1314306.1 rRNA maturation RNase YbeY [Sulfitobacter mediterraneus]MBM1322666.1 rRNA maturation RNase YbeY [Sulfitobacter mediterraneus]MBM1326578.1 rRNA maturation RNase YbeY [Sulfitobacter mediterraneus]MBM1397924.1 rRNA maturation RNase YbeY [Sulfitobacter mediterraneus]